jgi:4-amino-4-deoxy-L-arabinose transferase-like glycosyltransferase
MNPAAGPARSGDPDAQGTQPAWGALVAVVLAAGAALRIARFWAPELWLDEYATSFDVVGGWGEVASRVAQNEATSPFYYYLVKLSAEVLGYGPVGLRLPSVLAGLLLLGATYPLAHRLFGDRHAALVALVAVAVNERLIFYGQSARTHGLALAAAVLSFLAYAALWRTERTLTRVGWVLATAAAVYANYLFGVVALAQALHLAAARGVRTLLGRPWGLTWLALGAVLLPLGVLFAGVLARRHSFDWLRPAVALAPARVLIDLLDPWVFTAVAVTVLMLGAVEPLRLARDGPVGVLFLWLLVPVGVFSLVPPLLGVSLLYSRYVIVAAPAAVLALAWCAASVGRQGALRWLPVVVLVCTTVAWNHLPALRETGTFAQWPPAGWNAVAAHLTRHAAPGEVVLVNTDYALADEVADPVRGAAIGRFVVWPVSSHFPAARRDDFMGLPLSATPATLAYLDAAAGRAAGVRRVWIVGGGAVGRYVTEVLLPANGFVRQPETVYAGIRVIPMERP